MVWLTCLWVRSVAVYRIWVAFQRLGSSGSARVASVLAALMSALTIGSVVQPVFALSVELDDVAPDRIERQRMFARGVLPTSLDPDTFEIVWPHKTSKGSDSDPLFKE